MSTRRDFFATTLAAVGAAALRLGLSWAQARKTILILDGTGFVGPHQVRRAIERRHRVTIFNRGRRRMIGGAQEALPALYTMQIELT